MRVVDRKKEVKMGRELTCIEERVEEGLILLGK